LTTGALLRSGLPAAHDFILSIPEGHPMSLASVALIVLLLLVVGTMPTWAHSRNWGYAPSAGLGAIAFAVLVMLAMGVL
jgi:hypothetical protein